MARFLIATLDFYNSFGQPARTDCDPPGQAYQIRVFEFDARA